MCCKDFPDELHEALRIQLREAQKELADLHEYKFNLYNVIERLEEELAHWKRTAHEIDKSGTSLLKEAVRRAKAVIGYRNRWKEVAKTEWELKRFHRLRAESAEKQLLRIVREAEGMPEEGLAQAIKRAASAEKISEEVAWFVEEHYKDGVCLVCSDWKSGMPMEEHHCWVGALDRILCSK